MPTALWTPLLSPFLLLASPGPRTTSSRWSPAAPMAAGAGGAGGAWDAAVTPERRAAPVPGQALQDPETCKLTLLLKASSMPEAAAARDAGGLVRGRAALGTSKHRELLGSWVRVPRERGAWGCPRDTLRRGGWKGDEQRCPWWQGDRDSRGDGSCWAATEGGTAVGASGTDGGGWESDGRLSVTTEEGVHIPRAWAEGSGASARGVGCSNKVFLLEPCVSGFLPGLGGPMATHQAFNPHRHRPCSPSLSPGPHKHRALTGPAAPHRALNPHRHRALRPLTPHRLRPRPRGRPRARGGSPGSVRSDGRSPRAGHLPGVGMAAAAFQPLGRLPCPHARWRPAASPNGDAPGGGALPRRLAASLQDGG